MLARPLAHLIPDGGPRPERVSRVKKKVIGAFAALVAAASRRGRPVRPPVDRAPLLGALLALATRLLMIAGVPRRRNVQDEIVCAFDRLHAEHGVTAREFAAALAIPERTLHSWRHRPSSPPPPPVAKPRSSPPRDRGEGRFDLEETAPGTQLGGDTTDLTVLGVKVKLTAAQDIGDRKRSLFESFAVDEHETAALVTDVLKDAVDGREGLQFITDQGKPFIAEAAKEAYDALGVDHAPQREGTPTAKATVERGFGTVKNALAPVLGLLDRVAQAVPALRRADLAKGVGTLLVATFLRVYLAGRRHLAHPLDGKDPDVLRAIVEEQRENARAEDRSLRLFLEAMHAEYAMPGSREAFVRAFRRYPLDDLKEAERRFRPHACRCDAKLPDRYFAAVVRDVHEQASVRRAAERRLRREVGEARRAREDAARRAADLDENPALRLHEGLDLLVETWRHDEGRFLADGGVARAWLRRAIELIARRAPAGALDQIEAHVRAWEAARPKLPLSICERVRGVLRGVITEIGTSPNAISPSFLVDAMLSPSIRSIADNPRPSPSPHLRI